MPDVPSTIIPRRARVSWWLGIVLALGFALIVTPTITAEHWLVRLGAGQVVAGQPAPLTIRVPAFAGTAAGDLQLAGGGIVIMRGEVATAEQAAHATAVIEAQPRGLLPYAAVFLLAFVLTALFTHHMRRSTRGRLVRVQIVSLVSILVLAIAVKTVLLTTAVSLLAIPVGLLAIVPILALDRIVGLATGILAALTVGLLGPFDVGIAVMLITQAAAAGLIIHEQPKARWRTCLTTGAITVVCTAGTYVLLTFLTTGALPVHQDALHATWLAAMVGPLLATALAVPLVPAYQLLVGEITRAKLVELEDLSNPLLRQIAERSPGTWQHSLMMANMAEVAANTIGASGRLVRVGAYYHDLGKSLQPKYFIENLEPGETSPHDQLPPEVSCDAIFAHVTEGIVAARKASLHERIVDFMHMHHGDGVLEYFWGKTQEAGNPRGLSIAQFRYPGHPPQSRETAILAICDAVEAASRTLKRPEPAAIDALVQRIVYGKLHLGQLDESGLSMSDLRRVADSLRETIRHANHGRIEYPWQKAAQDASASQPAPHHTAPRLDSLDRAPARRPSTIASPGVEPGPVSAETTAEVGIAATADLRGAVARDDLAIIATAPALVREVQPARQTGAHRIADLMKVRAGSPPVDPEPAPERLGPPPRDEPATARTRAATLPPARARPPSAHGDAAERARPPRWPAEPRRARQRDHEPAPCARAPRDPRAPVPDIDDGAMTNPAVRPPIDQAATTTPTMRRAELETFPFEQVGDDEDLMIPPAPAPMPAPASAERSRRLAMPLRPSSPPSPTLGPRPAALTPRRPASRDEWAMETPVRAPTASELRSLLGQPDPTRQQSLEEIDRLHHSNRGNETPEPELFLRRPGRMSTTEVDPDDIEAAIELAPPARRSTGRIPVLRSKKPE